MHRATHATQDGDQVDANGAFTQVKTKHKHKRSVVTNLSVPIVRVSGLLSLTIFKRGQFPIHVAFSMTINKSEVQTLLQTVIYFPEPVFQHDQLYVAVSRVTSPENLEILINTTKFQGPHADMMLTKNIIFQCLLT